MRRQQSKNLSTAPRFFLQAGSSLWVPFGFIPLLLGVDLQSDGSVRLAEKQQKGRKDKRAKDEATSFLVYTVMLALRPEADAAAPPDLRACVLAAHQLCANHFPPSFRCKVVQAWAAALATKPR